jgi:hypothetical protein
MICFRPLLITSKSLYDIWLLSFGAEDVILSLEYGGYGWYGQSSGVGFTGGHSDWYGSYKSRLCRIPWLIDFSP